MTTEKMPQTPSFLDSLRTCLNDHTCQAGRRLDAVVITLVFISITLLCINSTADIAQPWKWRLQALETALLCLFAIEYLMRLWATPRRRDYAFSFFGIVDLLAILPLIFISADLQTLRAFRFLRIFSMFKLLRYRDAMEDLSAAFRQSREELIIFVVITSIMLFISSVAIYHFEHEAQPEHFGSLFDSVWWSVVTMTTVGYGDLAPITAGGRLFAMALLIIGIGIVAVPTGLITSSLSGIRRHREGKR